MVMTSDTTETWIDPIAWPGVAVAVDVIDGRVTVVGVKVTNPEGVSLEDLRAVPVHRFEAQLNDSEDLLAKWTQSKMRRAAALAALEAEAEPPTGMELRLKIPDGRRYPDEFYEAIADLYRRLVATGKRPAPALAKANDVPTTTVHRWVKEARARGLLAPARKGGSTG